MEQKDFLNGRMELGRFEKGLSNEELPPILTSGHQIRRVNFNVIEKLMT